MTELSDQYLLRAFRRGDRGAFDAIFRRYARRVYATAYRLTGCWEDTEDTLQEVFLQLARHAGSIRHDRALSSWIYRTTVNRAHDRLRKRRHTVSLDEDRARTHRIIEVESLRREALQQDLERQESFLHQVAALVPRLSERQAAVFVLFGFQGLSHREIAQTLECSEASSRTSYSLACKKMREWVEAAEKSRAVKGESDEA